MPSFNIHLTIAVSASMLVTPVSSAQSFCRPLQITSPNGSPNDQHGFSVDIEGDTIIAGAPRCLQCVTQPGAAHVYTRDGLGWVFQSELVKPDAAPGDRFGVIAKLSGDTAIVAASTFNAPINENNGSVDVYVREGSLWSHEATLLPPSSPSNFGFFTCEIDGDTVIISNGDALSSLGAVFVYTRENGAWSLQETLTPPDSIQTGTWGDSVALSGDTIVVGNPAMDAPGFFDSGGADIFVRENGAWTHQQRLSPDDPQNQGNFGQDVAIHDDTVALGAPRRGDLDGAVYVFRRNASTWSFSQRLDPPVPAFHPRMGSAISLDEMFLVTNSDGRSAVFRPDNGIYALETYIGGHEDFSSPITHQQRTFVTAHLTNGPSFSPIPGAILYYEARDSSWECCTGDCDATGEIDFDDLVQILFDFGTPGLPGCDADEDGTVDFNDLISAIFLFGPCP